MSDREVSIVSEKKYLELAFEYNKLKEKFKQLGVLSQRIISEKESVLADVVQTNRQLRQALQENENLKFHNNQLSVRFNILQEELENYKSKEDIGEISYSRKASLSHTRSNSRGFIDPTHTTSSVHTNDGINTFVEVTKQQVAHMADENEELLRTIQNMKSEFDNCLAEKNSKIELLQNKILNLKQKYASDSLIVSLPRKILNNSSKDEHVANKLENKSTIINVYSNNNKNDNSTKKTYFYDKPLHNKYINNQLLFDKHYISIDFGIIPCRITRKKIKNNERIIICCLSSLIMVIRNVCSDLAETIRNSSQYFHGHVQYYDFSAANSLIQIAQSTVDDYKNLVPLFQNRFLLIYSVIRKCCAALTMTNKLLKFHFNQSFPSDCTISGSNQCILQYRFIFLELCERFLMILSATCKNLVYTESQACDENVISQKCVVLCEIKTNVKLFMCAIDQLVNSDSTNNFGNIDCSITSKLDDPIDSVNSVSYIDYQNQIYYTIVSLLKARSQQLKDALQMTKLVVKSEKDLLINFGWYSHYLELDNHLSEDMAQHLFLKVTNYMNATNNKLKSSHFSYSIEPIYTKHNIQSDGGDIVYEDINDGFNHYFINSLKENYFQLQNQLNATIKKLDEVSNTNELLNFKIKTCSIKCNINLDSIINNSTISNDNLCNELSFINKIVSDMRDYLHERVSFFQTQHRNTLSQVYMLLTDWSAMKYRLEDSKKNYKIASNDALRYKNECNSLKTHLISMKESYEKNVVELTEKLSINMASQKAKR